MAKKCVHAYFEGVVQGVGFRFTARHLANRHKAKGWVKNLLDGRVELVVEGEEDNVDLFFKDLLQDMKRYITDYQFDDTQETSGYDNLQVKF